MNLNLSLPKDFDLSFKYNGYTIKHYEGTVTNER